MDSTISPRLSIVVPVRNEAPNILPLLEEIEAACGKVGSYEVVYVDDPEQTADFVVTIGSKSKLR